MENITYTCTKVNLVDEGPITSGCYSQYDNGREIQICVCRSNNGEIPCNGTSTITILLYQKLTFSIIYILLINYFIWTKNK